MSLQILSNQTDFENPSKGIENDTDTLNRSFVNGTEETPTTLTYTEVVTITVTGLLGFAGILMNSAVLAVVYKGGLVKRDHRMLYYIFMTIGDLMLAFYAFINAFNFIFRNWYVFKNFAVCFNIQLIMGTMSYQWSAICIILLIVDLTWSVKFPLSKLKHKKLFAKVGCFGTFFLGFAITIVPHLYWNDSPAELVYCSTAKVYGIHFDFFQKEAVAVLSILLVCMLGACLNLLLAVCRTHKTKFSQNRPTTSRNPQPRKRNQEMSMSEPTKTSEISIQLKSEDGKQIKQNHPGSNADKKSEKVVNGSPNKALTLDKVNESKHAKNRNKDDSSYTQADARRQRFIRACLTVGAFTATYVGCCMPIYVVYWVNVVCYPKCSEETPESRFTRVVVSTTVFLLPIIDPILYIKRFKLFNDTTVVLLRRLRNICYTRV